MEVDIDKYFAHALKKARDVRGITQEDLASAAELDRTYISMLERGLRKPSLEAVFSIAKAMNIKVTDLVHDVEKQLESESE